MNRVCVARGAAADEGGLSVLPQEQGKGPAVYGGDALAEAALRACGALLAGLPEEARERTGLVMGTTLGCLEMDRAFDRSRREAQGRYASPAAFSRTLPSTVAAEVSVKLQLRGPSLVVSGAQATALALWRAARWMGHFDLAYCIAGGADWAAAGGAGEEQEGCAVALVLLSRDAAADAVGVMRIGAATAEMPTARDEGLHLLARWIRHPEALGLGGGIFLIPPLPDRGRRGGGQ